MGKRYRRIDRRVAIAFAVAIVALPIPALAQFFGSPYYGQQRSYRPPPQRGFFSFPFFGNGGGGGYGGGGGGGDQFNPFYRPAPPPVESYKAPPPRKVDTPPTTTVTVIGDTMADWLAYGLEEVLTDTPDVGVTRNIRPTSGLVRYDPKNDSLDWSGVIKDALVNDKPAAIVVMLGLNDRLPLREKVPPKTAQSAPAQQQAQDKSQDKSQEKNQEKTQDKTSAAPSPADKPDGEQPPPTAAASEPQRPGPGGSYDFHTDKWAELYGKRVDDMIAALKTKGVPIIWVGLPAVYGTKSTGDMSYLDEIFRARAERAGILYVDIWDGFVDESGRYVTQGPDFEGQIRRLRTGDGVHFTKAGAVKMAQYVAQDLRRIFANRAVPVSLPAAPEAAAPKPGDGAGTRPVAGPVLPLGVDTKSDSNALLGDGGRTTAANADPVAVRVLSHGDPITAPAGRADDFSWPRRGNDANAEAAPEPGAATPPATPPKGASPAAPKKSDDGKTDPKIKVAPAAPATPTAPVRRPSASLDGAPPRPPAAIGGGF
jgi:uncharacterized protein